MHMAVDQPRREGRTLGIDNGGRALRVNVFLFADGGDFSINNCDGVRVEDWILQISAQKDSEIPDHKTGFSLRAGQLVLSHSA
jgi:hypothetical protein